MESALTERAIPGMASSASVWTALVRGGKGRGGDMRDRRLARYLLALLYFAPLVGCQVFQGEPQLVVQVRDAETKKPLPSAEVYLCQRLKDNSVEPCRSPGLTQEDGTAHLKAVGGQYGVEVQAVAAGYLPEKVTLSAEDLKKIKTIPTSATKEPRPADAIVEAYAEPSFSVELVVPVGYRGLIEAEIVPRNNITNPIGQRRFCFTVPPSAIVRIEGPALLQRVAVADYRARYVGGPLLTATMDEEKVGFRWLKGSGRKHYFLIGTLSDYETVSRRLAPEQQATSDAWEDPSIKEKRSKYRYGQITNKNEESARR